MTLKKYVESGKFDKHMEEEFKVLQWFCSVVIVLGMGLVAWALWRLP